MFAFWILVQREYRYLIAYVRVFGLMPRTRADEDEKLCQARGCLRGPRGSWSWHETYGGRLGTHPLLL